MRKRFKTQFVFSAILMVLCMVASSIAIPQDASARSKRSASRSRSSRTAHVSHGRKRVSSHHSRRGATTHRRTAKVPKTRYAYPIDIFMMHPPEFDQSPLSQEQSNEIRSNFENGVADELPARSLVRAGVVKYHALRGGIFWRREPVKYIIVHSTEPGIPLSAVRIIESWSSMGRRHPGAQYVVDRDGSIYQAVDPDLATVHVNIFKTLPGINNDNSIGIEMCHTGKQDYPHEQRQSVIRLVNYLQQRYKVDDENIITHRYAQQGDHTDPVNFDFTGFLQAKNNFKNKAIALRIKDMKEEGKTWERQEMPSPTTILQPHTSVSAPRTVAPLRGPIEVDPQAASVIATPQATPPQAQPNATGQDTNGSAKEDLGGTNIDLPKTNGSGNGKGTEGSDTRSDTSADSTSAP